MTDEEKNFNKWFDEYNLEKIYVFEEVDLKMAYLQGCADEVKKWEKVNGELRSENAELKTVKIPQLERKIASIRGCHRVDLEKLKARLEQVERLKQEIAELKRDKQDLIFIRNQKAKCMCEDKENLTKAKEIIRKLINSCCSKGATGKATADAEQFLKE